MTPVNQATPAPDAQQTVLRAEPGVAWLGFFMYAKSAHYRRGVVRVRPHYLAIPGPNPDIGFHFGQVLSELASCLPTRAYPALCGSDPAQSGSNPALSGHPAIPHYPALSRTVGRDLGPARFTIAH